MSFLSFFSKSKSSSKPNSVSNKLSSSISQIFTHKKLNDGMIEELEDVLISADIGSEVALFLSENLRKEKFQKDCDALEVKEFLAQKIEEILLPYEKNLDIEGDESVRVLIFNGVNGVGKTTTIGKIAANLKSQNKKVLIAACDSFRSAAVEQLTVWADRVDCEIMKPQKEGEDPAAIAYRAYKYAKEKNFDILLIDTAGRLQNKQNLMDELKKINTVLKKIDAAAPHENILVLDSTVGQNAHNQLDIFDKIVGITGLIITKLDGTAKGGVVVSLVKSFSKPIYAIGVGEKVEDLQEFNAKNFSRNLLGL